MTMWRERAAPILSPLSPCRTIAPDLLKDVNILQILQLEIETDGRALVQSLQRQLDRLSAVGNGDDCSPRVGERRKRTLGLLTRAWHKLWIKSIELQCKIEERFDRIEVERELFALFRARARGGGV